VEGYCCVEISPPYGLRHKQITFFGFVCRLVCDIPCGPVIFAPLSPKITDVMIRMNSKRGKLSFFAGRVQLTRNQAAVAAAPDCCDCRRSAALSVCGPAGPRFRGDRHDAFLAASGGGEAARIHHYVQHRKERVRCPQVRHDIRRGSVTTRRRRVWRRIPPE
jgi:hypothetical protein